MNMRRVLFNSQMLPAQTVSIESIPVEPRNNTPAAAIPLKNRQPTEYFESVGQPSQAETPKYLAADLTDFPKMEI